MMPFHPMVDGDVLAGRRQSRRSAPGAAAGVPIDDRHHHRRDAPVPRPVGPAARLARSCAGASSGTPARRRRAERRTSSTTYEAELGTNDTNEIWAAVFTDVEMQVPGRRDARRRTGRTDRSTRTSSAGRQPARSARATASTSRSRSATSSTAGQSSSVPTTMRVASAGRSRRMGRLRAHGDPGWATAPQTMRFDRRLDGHRRSAARTARVTPGKRGNTRRAATRRSGAGAADDALNVGRCPASAPASDRFVEVHGRIREPRIHAARSQALGPLARSGCTSSISRADDFRRSAARAPRPVSASGPVSRKRTASGSGSASTAAATSAMSRGSIHAIRPSPVGNTRRPRRSNASWRSSTDAKNEGCNTVEATADARVALDGAVVAVQPAVEAVDRAGSRPSRCARRRRPRPRRSRSVSRIDLILRRRAHEEGTLHLGERGSSEAGSSDPPARRWPSRRRPGSRAGHRPNAAPRATKPRATSAPSSPVAPITSTVTPEVSHVYAAPTCGPPSPARLARTDRASVLRLARKKDRATLHCARAPPRTRRRPGADGSAAARVPRCASCAHEGWRENLSGHITWATPDGGMWCNPWGIWWDEVRASDILRLDADGEIVEGDVGRHARGVPAHRAAPYTRRRDGHRAQPPVLRDLARGDARDAADGAPELVHLRRRARARRRVRRRRRRRAGQVARRAGGRRERDPARAPRRDRDRLDHRRGVLQGRDLRARCAASPTTSLATGRDCRVEIPADAQSRAEGPRCTQNTPAARTGTAPSACCSHANRRCPDMNMSLDDLAGSEAFGGNKGRREQITWLPEPRATSSAIHRHLRRRSRGRAARRVHRPLPEEVRRRRAPRRRHRRRRRGVGVARQAASERRVQRGRRPAVERVRLRTDTLRRDAPRARGT